MTIINSTFTINYQVSAFKWDHTCAFSAKGSWTVSVSVWVCHFWGFFKSGVYLFSRLGENSDIIVHLSSVLILFRQINNIVQYWVSSTKQAKGDNMWHWQGTKTPSGDRIEKKPWEKPGSVEGPVFLWPTKRPVYEYGSDSLTG